PLPKNELYALLLCALAELDAKVAATHTVVDQAVEASAMLGFERARGLVNAVLRNSLRRAPELEQALSGLETARFRHPQWWIDRLRRAYPDDWQAVLERDNAHPPMTLRVNVRRTPLPDCRARL